MKLDHLRPEPVAPPAQPKWHLRSQRTEPVKRGPLGLEKETRPTPPPQSKCLWVNGIAQYSTTTEPEVEGSSGEAGSSWSGADDTTSADDSTVAKAFGAAQPPGTAVHGVSTAFKLAASSGEAGSARPEEKDTTKADVTAVAMPAGEARPLLGSHSTVPRQNLKSKGLPAKLGFFGPEQMA